jgi:inosine-uridine nucleoside N-ribohydrolase
MSQKVLLDVDPGCDDAVMMAMALCAADLEVVGVTTVAGNSTVENTTRNALSVLAELDRTDVPVARGADRPLVDDLTTAEWVHGPAGLRGELPDPTRDPLDQHAVSFILDQAHRHGEALTLVAAGPLTNVAATLIQEPTLPDLVGDIHVMGGAATTAGNTTPAAEANFHNDPVAARRVVASATPRLVGLDALGHATVPASLVEEYRADPRLSAVGAWLDYPAEVRAFGPTDDPIIHDAAVVADLLGEVLTVESYHCEVDTSSGPSRGALVCDVHGVTGEEPNAEVAVEIDTEAFRQLLRSTLEPA